MTRPQVLGRTQHGIYCYCDNTFTGLLSAVPSALHSSSTSTFENVKLWHLRMGHLPFLQLKHVDSSLDVHTCRQTRQSFPVSFIKTTKPFQLLHSDIWGPYKDTTYNGCIIILTIVDDFTRST